MSPINSAIKPNSSQAQNSASILSPIERSSLAVEAIAKTASITELAIEANTSRKFVYAQKQKAETALEEVFSKQSEDEQVLFHLPVTKPWLKQLTLGLTLICHSSYQGVTEIFRDLFDSSISKGQVHNIIRSSIEEARQINPNQDLSNVRIGAHDEIFQNGSPVLVGCDTKSSYCYLLTETEYRDATSWGTHLLDLREHQNLKPHHSIADGGRGLRKGQAEAWPDVPCHGDVFHALKPLLELVVYLENHAYKTIAAQNSIEKQLSRPRHMAERQKHMMLQKKLIYIEEKARKAIELADDVGTLYKWVREDILSLVGPRLEDRQSLLKFIVESLRSFESQYKLRPIRSVRLFLENQRDNLLAFAKEIDTSIQEISRDFGVNPAHVRSLYELQHKHISTQIKWEKEAELRNLLSTKFHPIELEITQVLKDTVRASSVVENLNSRLRNYFTLRRTVGKGYLSILQFFLNHRRFIRSTLPERVGKSPTELLTGQSHPHWLELLGFKLFKQAA